MPTSQNGYPANDETLLDVYTIPGTNVRVRLRRGPVAEILLDLLAWIDDHVEDIDTAGTYLADAQPSIPGGDPSPVPDDWSAAFRNVRGSDTVLSNHASGTAVDVNATQHPRGVRNTWHEAQRRLVDARLGRYVDPHTGRQVIRWGEHYVHSPVDGMHFEIDAPEDAVARALAASRGEPLPPATGRPPHIAPQSFTEKIVHNLPTLERGDRGVHVKTAQALLVAHGRALSIDGDFGPRTQTAVQKFQVKEHIGADGVVGPTTWVHLLSVA